MKLSNVTAALFFATLSASLCAQDGGSSIDLEERTATLLRASPQEILKIREKVQRSSAARQAPIQSDFSDEIPQDIIGLEDIFEITLQPDQVVPKVLLARFQSTAISFIDAYGNPWPIRKISSFLSGIIAIDRAVDGAEEGSSGTDVNDPQAGSFTMTALKHGATGNIIVYLQGLSTPISISVEGKPSMYHQIATLRVSDVGPQTDPLQIHSEKSVTIGTENDVDLNNALYGVTPVGSEQLVVQGAEGKAWLKGDFVYIQTPLALFAPEIYRVSPGNGRYKAYKMARTTTALGTNNEGRTVTLKLLKHPYKEVAEMSFEGGVDQ